MTTTVEPGTRGIDALCTDMDGNVALLPALIFDQLFAEMMGQLPTMPALDFDEEPWRQLATIEDLQHLWLACTPLDQIIAAVALVANGGRFDDLPRYLAEQRFQAELDLAWIKEREAQDAGRQAVDTGGSGEPAPVASAAAQGGGGDLPGGSEDSDPVGAGGEDLQHQDAGSPPKVSGKRRAAKAAGG